MQPLIVFVAFLPLFVMLVIGIAMVQTGLQEKLYNRRLEQAIKLILEAERGRKNAL